MRKRYGKGLFIVLLILLVFVSSSCRKTRNSTKSANIGLVVIDNENDQGYTYNFIKGMNDALDRLGSEGYELTLRVKRNITEDGTCWMANKALVDEECRIIFNNSFGFEPYMQQVAKDNPGVAFVGLTCSNSQIDEYENTYNAFAAIHEGRYLSGVVAGMKLQEMIDNGDIQADQALIGYVGAYSYAEVISGMTAYYLGAKSVCPTVKMKVQFVGSWSNAEKEAEAAQNLINEGALVLSQHSDTTAPATVAEENGVYHTGYNNDMIGVAPHASLISCRIDWSDYFYTFIKNNLDGKKNPSDFTGSLKDGSVVLTKLNEQQAAPGTAEKLKEVEKGLVEGKLYVFDLTTFTINGHLATNKDMYDPNASVKGAATYKGYFHESETQSAPYFVGRIDGITWLNSAY